MSPWSRGLTRNVVLLGVASLLTDLSSEILVPLLPIFILSLPGAGYLVLGAIESIAESAVSLLQLLSGHLSDRFGRRKRFVALGYGLSTAMKAILPVATVWPHVLVARVGDRVGKGVRNPPRDAIIRDSTESDTVGKAFGFHRALDTTGAILGPLVVLLLFPAVSFQGMFAIAVVPAFAAFLVILLVRERRAPAKPGLRLRVALRALPVRLRLFIIVAGLYSLANFSFLIVLAYIRERAISFGFAPDAATQLVVLDYLIFNIVYAALSTRAGSLSDSIGRKPVILVGYTAFVAGSLGLALVGNPHWMLPFLLLYGIAFAFAEGTQRALVTDLASEEVRGTGLGTYHAAVGLGKLPSSILAGLLAVTISTDAAFLASAGIAAIAATLFIGTFAEPKRAKREDAGED